MSTINNRFLAVLESCRQIQKQGVSAQFQVIFYGWDNEPRYRLHVFNKAGTVCCHNTANLAVIESALLGLVNVRVAA